MHLENSPGDLKTFSNLPSLSQKYLMKCSYSELFNINSHLCFCVTLEFNFFFYLISDTLIMRFIQLLI